MSRRDDAMPVRNGAIALILACLPATTFAQGGKQITGIYSNLAYTRESRTLSGTEIFIVRGAGERYVAFVQEANGESADPVLASVVQNGDHVSVRFHAQGYMAQYDGTIGKTGFDGVMTVKADGGQTSSGSFHLRRKKSYWQ